MVIRTKRIVGSSWVRNTVALHNGTSFFCFSQTLFCRRRRRRRLFFFFPVLSVFFLPLRVRSAEQALKIPLESVVGEERKAFNKLGIFRGHGSPTFGDFT